MFEFIVWCLIWVVLGCFLGRFLLVPIGILIIFFLDKRVLCPGCGKEILGKHGVCPWCRYRRSPPSPSQ